MGRLLKEATWRTEGAREGEANRGRIAGAEGAKGWPWLRSGFWRTFLGRAARGPWKEQSAPEVCKPLVWAKPYMGTWCSGITSAPHAEGPEFKSQCVHASVECEALGVNCGTAVLESGW